MCAFSGGASDDLNLVASILISPASAVAAGDRVAVGFAARGGGLSWDALRERRELAGRPWTRTAG
jgi:hypothetical protein